MSDVDLFEGLDTVPADGDAQPEADAQTDNSSVTTNGEAEASTPESADNESPVETVAQVPDGAMSVTEFAAHMTQTLMRDKFQEGLDLDGSEYVVPQAVYQTVKAQRDRIPHVIVKGADDAEGRVYILREDATVWWKNRKERLSTRGQGSARASSRTPEDNLALLAEAVRKALYAQDRSAMWKTRVEQSGNLVDKYKGFLNDQSVSEETVALTIQDATDQYNTEKAQKEAEKAEKAKKSGKDSKTETDDNE